MNERDKVALSAIAKLKNEDNLERDEVKGILEYIVKLERKIKDQEEKIKKSRSILEFYASKDSWGSYGESNDAIRESDVEYFEESFEEVGGLRARRFLNSQDQQL